MQNPNRDLWPEDIGSPANFSTPLSILREQASLLGQKTQNLVNAEVTSQGSDRKDDEIEHYFYLLAPGLGHYRYLLFRVYQPTDLYPLTISTDTLDKPMTAKSQDEFIERLKEIFSLEKTKKVIHSLIVQSRK